jgi:hypothetical protein
LSISSPEKSNAPSRLRFEPSRRGKAWSICSRRSGRVEHCRALLGEVAELEARAERTVPASGSIAPAISFSSVDLPAPLRPSRTSARRV